jgi:hypothetical protein
VKTFTVHRSPFRVQRSALKEVKLEREAGNNIDMKITAPIMDNGER